MEGREDEQNTDGRSVVLARPLLLLSLFLSCLLFALQLLVEVVQVDVVIDL